MSTQVKWYGDKVKARVLQGGADGLEKAADHVLRKSQPLVPVAPIEGGKLKETGKVSVDRGALRAAISYDIDYAVAVHEDLNDRHASGTQAKYLEQPLNSERDEVLRIIGRETKQDLSR